MTDMADTDDKRFRSAVPHPLSFHWEREHGLPTKIIKAPRAPSRLSTLLAGPGWITTGPPDQPFDFCGLMRRLLLDVVARCPELNHVDVPRLLVGVTQARSAGKHGLQARVTPLRFARGRLTRVRRDVVYQVQRFFHGEQEFLYLLTFCLPRFLDQDFDSKLITIFHELFHISPLCDGDLRRHEGRYRIHTHSQKEYDRLMAHLARAYLATRPEPAHYEFLRLSFAQLHQRHGGVAGVVVPRPKIIPLLPAVQEG